MANLCTSTMPTAPVLDSPVRQVTMTALVGTTTDRTNYVPDSVIVIPGGGQVGIT